MNGTDWRNGAAAALALLLAAAVGAHQRPGGEPPAGDRAAGATALRDAGGQLVRVRDFRRIVSGSTIADRLLIELCEPDRVVAFTGYGAAHSPLGYQYAGKALLHDAGDVERVVALRPDLLLTNSFGSPAKLARLREAGITVFDLGEARGVASLLADARAVGTLLGHPERGERFAAAFARRMEQVAAAVPPAARRRALYLGVYGNQLLGGGPGSSYHDVLSGAGLVDVGAPGWPRYSPEQLLTLDPEVIVTKRGMQQSLCGRAPFERLRACAGGGVVEAADDQLDDPSTGMLDAAEQIAARVYGAR